MLKNGSCATRGCEPCQVGNQAALSGLLRVPQGCLFGAEAAVTVCKGIFDGRVYGSIRRTEDLASMRDNFIPYALLFLYARYALLILEG